MRFLNSVPLLKWFGVLAVVAAIATPAAAQEPNDVNIQNFRPAMDSKGFITIERSKALGTLDPSIGLYLNWMWNPLKQEIDGKDYDLVDSYGAANFVFAIGFANIVEIGANVPVVIIRGDADGPGDAEQLSGDGFGDLGLSAKIRILDRQEYPVGIALVPIATFGTGEKDIFASHGGNAFGGRLVIDMDLGARVGLALNVGGTFREKREISGNVTITDAGGVARTVARADPYILGNEVTYGLGVGFALIPQRLEFILEGFGAAPIESGAERATPLEALAAFRVFLVGNSFFSVGATRGFLNSYGDPDVRVFAGIVFEPSIGDRDFDGVKDDVDQCPDDAEDIDGFQDEDGCPDPDNDNDGIPDLVDQCPDVPEDMNGFEDEDGCPEGGRDRDGDGILDVNDKCPDDPEDKDGFEDEDGCPDPDNDRDGILDVDDKCPNDPEDIDGWEDEDGCPDPDNDADGILDVDDQCPNEPENFNGIEDEDGCPEVPKKVVITGGKIKILEKVYFETNKAVIKPESYDILNQVAEVLQQNPQITKVEVQGHTDSRGSDSYNLDLSNRRAAAVRTYLIDRGGVDPGRLSSRGYGETEPVDPEENVQAWAANRRVEFIILEENGKRTRGRDMTDSPVVD